MAHNEVTQIIDGVDRTVRDPKVVIGEVTNEMTGYPNRTDSTMSFDDGTRTFTIQPASSLFRYYIKGVEYVKTSAQTVVIPDTEGVHFIYFDGETLSSTTTFSNAIFQTFGYTAVIYWNATDNEAIYLGEERHGLTMSGDTHLWAHETFGTRFESGLATGDITADDTGNVDAHAQISVADGEVHDEDIEVHATDGSPQELTPIAAIPVFYKDGASAEWKKDTATNFPVKSFVGGSSRLAWNEFTGGSWQQTEVSNVQFVLSHMFMTNDIDNPIISVQGEATYNSIITARQGATTEINALVTAGLPFQEFIPISTVIFQTSTGYSNTPQARIRTTDTGEDYIDWRFAMLSPVSIANDHGNLSGLADDDHTQYSLISSQAGVPSSTPSRVGLTNIDTTNNNAYVSTDTASSADWERTDGAGGGSSTFLGLTDTPAGYTANLRVKANAGATALEFYSVPIDAKADHGAVGDGQRVRDGVTTASSTTVTSASGLFVAGDVGKTIFIRDTYVAGAGNTVVETTIATYVSATEITVTSAPTNTATGVYIVWGTDDTTALQNALDAIPDSGGVLYIPAGMYLATSDLTVVDKSGFKIEGAGLGTVLVRTSGTILDISSTGAPYTYSAQSLEGYLKGIRVTSLGLDCIVMDSSATETVGLMLTRVCMSQIDHIYPMNCGRAVEQRGVSRTTFEHFYSPDYAVVEPWSFCGHYFYADGSVSLAVENDNTYRTMQINHHKTPFYFKGASVGNYWIDGINLYDVRSFNWGGNWYATMYNVYIEFGVWTNIFGNHFFGCGLDNIYVSNCRGYNITGNDLFWAGNGSTTTGYGVRVLGGTDLNHAINITGNSVERPMEHGIYVKDMDNVNITGNTVVDPSEAVAGVSDGIVVEDCNNVYIGANSISQPTGAGTYNKDIATVGTCTNTKIDHPYPADVDLAGGGEFGGSIIVKEVDGTPSVQATSITFPNASVTDNGDNTVAVVFSTDIVADGGNYTDAVADIDRTVDGGSYL